jgi:hypothetical protein
MNELELVNSLREEIPLTAASPAVDGAVLAAIQNPGRARRACGPRAGARLTPAGGRRRHRTLRVAAASLALSLCAATALVVVSRVRANDSELTWSGRPTAIWPAPGHPSVGRARTEAQLVDYAARQAAAMPGRAPSPQEWIMVKVENADSSAGSGGFLFGPPDERVIGVQWVRVDWGEFSSGISVPATLPPGKLVTAHLRLSPGGPGATLGGWKSVSYSYLASLPSDPAALESVILAGNTPGKPWYSGSRDAAIFSAIATLLEGQADGVLIPPELAVTMYRILQQLPGVRFDSQTDLAGRTGLGLYMIIDGWYKQELVISPVNYTYMGDKNVAVEARTIVATGGTRHIAKGQVLGWGALLQSAVVQHPGQIP